jgi:hypothetical protein
LVNAGLLFSHAIVAPSFSLRAIRVNVRTTLRHSFLVFDTLSGVKTSGNLPAPEILRVLEPILVRFEDVSAATFE